MCRLSREERLFAKARDKFGDEIDIVKVLKRMRKIDALWAIMNGGTSLSARSPGMIDGDALNLIEDSDDEIREKQKKKVVPEAMN